MLGDRATFRDKGNPYARVPPSGGVGFQNFARNPVLVNERLSASCYRPQTLASNMAKSQEIFIILFDLLGQTWKTLTTDAIYVIDSLPIAVWDNIRIRRSKMYSDEHFRGYQASKKRYFYGLKIHLMVTQAGQPVECFLTHGGFGDVDALKYYAYELPDGSIIYADKAYNDYEVEDLLQEVDHIQLIPIRKKNSKRALPPYISFVQRYHRKRVETAGSLIAQLLPKSIHAVTPQGFALKVALFVIASSLNSYLNL